MIILIRKRHVAYVVLLCCFVAGLSAVLWHGNAAFTAAFAPEEGTPFTVVVDAGHGGEDGGAVAGDGTVESGLNLSIARRVRDLLTFAGVSTAVTREGEDAIYDPGSASLREKKVSDLHNRVDLVNAIPGAVLVSIHQNSYPDPSVKGAQIFYFTHSDKGKQAAEALQKELLEFDQENTRDIKANDTYYLLKKTEAPVVIVECGFLSNWADCAKLQDENYQDKLVWAIHMGILKYMNSV